jgi:hypothetical protein
MTVLLRIGTKVRTIDRWAQVHGLSPDKPEGIGTIRDHHRPYGRQSKDRTPPYYVTFDTGEAAWYDASEVERAQGSRSIHHATAQMESQGSAQEAMTARIRKGTRGQIVNVDGDQRAAFFDGARARVQQRLYRPDEVLVELLDDGPGWPGGTWHHGTTGTIPLRYFIPDQGKKSTKQLERDIATALAGRRSV